MCSPSMVMSLGRDVLSVLCPWFFAASETFDVGMDSESLVALDYHDRAPFKFNGKIEKINIKYI